MDGKGRHEKLALHIGFCRDLPEHARIDLDEGRVAALFFSERFGPVLLAVLEFRLIARSAGVPSRRSDWLYDTGSN